MDVLHAGLASVLCAEYHVDGFRFDLASILTRAPSVWHPTFQGPDGEVHGVHAGAGGPDATGGSGGLVVLAGQD